MSYPTPARIDMSKYLIEEKAFFTCRDKFFEASKVAKFFGISRSAIRKFIMQDVFFSARAVKKKTYYKWYIAKWEVNNILKQKFNDGERIGYTGVYQTAKFLKMQYELNHKANFYP